MSGALMCKVVVPAELESSQNWTYGAGTSLGRQMLEEMRRERQGAASVCKGKYR